MSLRAHVLSLNREVFCPNDTIVHESSPNNIMFIIQRGLTMFKVCLSRFSRARV